LGEKEIIDYNTTHIPPSIIVFFAFNLYKAFCLIYVWIACPVAACAARIAAT
jgi:hypothetical protein